LTIVVELFFKFYKGKILKPVKRDSLSANDHHKPYFGEIDLFEILTILRNAISSQAIFLAQMKPISSK